MDHNDPQKAIEYLREVVEDHKRRSWPSYDFLIGLIEDSKPEFIAFQATLTLYRPFDDPGLKEWLEEQFRLALQHLTADEKRRLRKECNASAPPRWQGFIKAREEKASTQKA